LHGNVIDAVIDQVLTDRVVYAQVKGDLQLGFPRHPLTRQHRIWKTSPGPGRTAAKAADLRQDLPVEGLPREHLDALLAAAAGEMSTPASA